MIFFVFHLTKQKQNKFKQIKRDQWCLVLSLKQMATSPATALSPSLCGGAEQTGQPRLSASCTQASYT